MLEIWCARTWRYLQSIQEEISNSSNVSGGLRPTEIRLRSGCIEEIEANYKGDAVSDILPNISGGDECCQNCRSVVSCCCARTRPIPCCIHVQNPACLWAKTMTHTLSCMLLVEQKTLCT